ncbi:hypothetical protein HRG_005624 [Hirsutella rhossiliensis]|uniref:Secreted protein n=1 Tax=Hirsutella rhossiliensis TaxID=111463 RepID=A0A9P8MXQ6_9HYPO|nr:uncharacterized protein HRG_05624 [Hirsutella rhossiliensis]KAH0963114.1 hypothetical protein HRG_05624 [Hirsutella rhossiliensis]
MSPFSLVGNLTAVLAALAIGSRHASASLDVQAPDGGDVAPEVAQMDMEQPASSSLLRYGHCYSIQTTSGQVLGHQPSAWNYLRFGTGTKTAHFKVCQNVGHCTAPNTHHQTLPNRSRFWLFDVGGNRYSPNGHLVAANSPPFGSNRNTYPAGGAYRYYINFWGDNDCADSDTRLLGRCPIKLRVDNLRDDQGLTIVDRYLRTAPSKDKYITVTFHEARCPQKQDVSDVSDAEL